MAGGTASGKTEYATSYLTKKDQLVYDGTLKNEGGFVIKSKNIQKYTKGRAKLKVVLILPLDLFKSLDVFFARERKMPLENFFFTQIKSKHTVSKLLENTTTRVEIYVSSYRKDSERLTYQRLTFKSRRKASEFLQELIKYEREIALENGFDISVGRV